MPHPIMKDDTYVPAFRGSLGGLSSSSEDAWSTSIAGAAYLRCTEQFLSEDDKSIQSEVTDLPRAGTAPEPDS